MESAAQLPRVAVSPYECDRSARQCNPKSLEGRSRLAAKADTPSALSGFCCPARTATPVNFPDQLAHCIRCALYPLAAGESCFRFIQGRAKFREGSLAFLFLSQITFDCLTDDVAGRAVLLIGDGLDLWEKIGRHQALGVLVGSHRVDSTTATRSPPARPLRTSPRCGSLRRI
jgi:hypothetical protein